MTAVSAGLQSTNSGTSTSPSTAAPTDANAAYKVVILDLFILNNVTDSDATILAGAPAGFTNYVSQGSVGQGARGRLFSFWKRLTGDDSALTYSFTGQTVSTDWVVSARTYVGVVKVGNPYNAAIGSVTGGGSTATTTVIPSITPGSASAAVVGAACIAKTGATWTPPSGYVERADLTYLETFEAIALGAGATGTATATETGASNGGFTKGYQVALTADDHVDIRSSASQAFASAAAQTVTLPTHEVGDCITIVIPGKHDTASIPTINQGFTLVKSGTGGTGTAGTADVGPMFTAVYERIVAPGEGTSLTPIPNPTITPGGTAPNSWVALTVVTTFSTGNAWRDTIGANVGYAGLGSDTTTASPITAGVTLTDQPTAGDALLLFVAVPTDGASAVTPAATGTGLTDGTVVDFGTNLRVLNNLGTDMHAAFSGWVEFAGTASGAVTPSFVFNSGDMSGIVAVVARRQAVSSTTLTPGQASETDTAQALTIVPGAVSVAQGQSTETDTAQALTPAAVIVVPLGNASETDTDQAITPSTVITIGLSQASETDTAQPLVSGGTAAFAQVEETDTAGTLTPAASISLTVGQALDTDSAGVLTTQVTMALGQASEADESETLQLVLGALQTALGTATETDSAQPIGGAAFLQLGQASETDDSQPVTVMAITTVALGQATETDTSGVLTVFAVGGGETITLGQASETDTATTFTYTAPSGVTITLNRASETDTAQRIQWVTIPTPAGDLTLLIIDDELADTPANILVNVGNGNDGETISFSITGPAGYFSLLSTELDDEDGTVQISLPLPELTAGTYVLRAVGTASGEATDQLLVLEEPLTETPDPDDNTTPDVPTFTPDPAQHWQLIDNTTGDEHSYTFPHNPARWTNPNRPNFLEHEVTTAPDGNILAWEGAERSWTFEFSGYLDTQAQYEALEFWWQLRRRFWLIDHRNKAHYVTFEQPDMRARIVPNKPWAHDYTIRAIHFYRDGTA